VTIATTQDFTAHVAALERARFPLLYVVTREERRALVALQNVAHARGASFFTWSLTRGWTDPDGQAASFGSGTEDPRAALEAVVKHPAPGRELFVMCDLDVFLSDPGIMRLVRDLDTLLRERTQTLIVLSPQFGLPPRLASCFHVLDFPLPERGVFDELITRVTEAAASTLDGGKSRRSKEARELVPSPEARETLIRALAGLNYDEAENILGLSVVTRRRLDPDLVVEEKRQAIRKTEVLEVVTSGDDLDQVGGHEALKAWLREAQLSFSEDARAYGIEPVRSALLVGIPGAGKSLIAKAAGTSWHLPIVRMDIGRLMSGVVGASESRAREMTRIIEAISPALVWADEVEKGIGGVASSAHSDSGTTARVFGHLLTWLQESRAPFFLAATANDTSLLPPEFLRRFDSVWWFDVPTAAERCQIWTIHLGKRNREASSFDLDRLVEASERYTGAEIERATKQALRRAYLDGRREPTTDDLVSALRQAEPISATQTDRLRQARDSLGGLAKDTVVRAAAGTETAPGRETRLRRALDLS
jgi:SpoVK/Ycf46/Vps4 family AAA+-type ATPase